MSAAEILTNPVDARVASFVPAAQTRVLTDAFAFARWLTLECATATAERWVVLRSRRAGAPLLSDLPTHALVAMTVDMRQPPHMLQAARDALVLRYLANPEVQLRVMAVARELALDAETDRLQELNSQRGWLRRIAGAAGRAAAPHAPR